MKKPILDVIFASEKRKSVLLSLQDGPEEMRNLLDSLDTTRSTLLPQLRTLEDHYLIAHYDDTYELTTIGRLIVDKMLSFVQTIDVLDKNLDFFATHNIDPIPIHLLKRINEIKCSEIVEPSLVEIFEINKDFIEDTYQSSSSFFLSSFNHPTFPAIVSRLVELDRNVTIIMTKELFIKFKSRMGEQYKQFLSCKKVKFYVYKEDLELTSLSVCDNSFVLRLQTKDKKFSSKHLFCIDPKGSKWGRDFLDHFLKDSELITDI